MITLFDVHVYMFVLTTFNSMKSIFSEEFLTY